MPYSFLSHLDCSRTGDVYDADQVQGVSRVGAPLLARDDLEGVRAGVTREEIAGRPHDLWRYHEVLPVRDPAHVTTLGEGMTPLLTLPTRQRGRAARSMYAARAGIGSLIVMPVEAPEITRRECVVSGGPSAVQQPADRKSITEGARHLEEGVPGSPQAIRCHPLPSVAFTMANSAHDRRVVGYARSSGAREDRGLLVPHAPSCFEKTVRAPEPCPDVRSASWRGAGRWCDRCEVQAYSLMARRLVAT